MVLLIEIPCIMKHFIFLGFVCVCLRTQVPDAIEVGVDETRLSVE